MPFGIRRKHKCHQPTQCLKNLLRPEKTSILGQCSEVLSQDSNGLMLSGTSEAESKTALISIHKLIHNSNTNFNSQYYQAHHLPTFRQHIRGEVSKFPASGDIFKAIFYA